MIHSSVFLCGSILTSMLLQSVAEETCHGASTCLSAEDDSGLFPIEFMQTGLSLNRSKSSPAENEESVDSDDNQIEPSYQYDDLFAELRKDPDIPPLYLSCVQETVRKLGTAANLTDSELACKNESVCGSVFDDVSQIKFYMKVALNPVVKTVCETGFFRGQSAAMWLCAKPEMQLYSFDLNFPVPFLETLEAQFGSRFQHYEGDSTQTVPKTLASTPACCDVSVADGGHTGDVPFRDIQSFVHASASPSCTSNPSLLIVDEIMFSIGEESYSPDEEFTTTVAWATAVNSNLLTNSVCCGFSRGHFCTAYPTNSTYEPLSKALRAC